jgi:hypothetical protein
MIFGRMASIALTLLAIVGVFVEIPIVSNYALWVLVGAYLIWLGVIRWRRGWKPALTTSIVLTLLAIVGVFVEIPIVSNYAFWVMVAAYLVVFSRSVGSPVVR